MSDGSSGPRELPDADDRTNCERFLEAVEELYWLTLNPRQVDLCRDSDGRLYPGDPEPATNQEPNDATDRRWSHCA